MAIVYPRHMPTAEFSECDITFLDNVVYTPSDKGMIINRTQSAEPVAIINVRTGLIQPVDYRQTWSPWKNSLRGGLQLFYGFDVRRAKPQAHPDLPENTLANVTSLTRSTITMSGLPSGYTVTAGDRIGLEQNDKRGYYEILETVKANAQGVVTVTVYPFVHNYYFNNGAKVRLVKAVAKFVLDWQSWVEPTVNEPAAIVFKGMQRI